MSTEPDRDLAVRALEWRKRNDGGNLCVWWPAGSKPGDDAHPIMAVSWDQGGIGELGAFYNPADAKAMETIVEVFNWALAQLVPSETDWYGTRTYLTDERPEVTG